MPIYDYDCAACGRRFEVLHGVNARVPRSARRAARRGPMRKQFAAPAIHFKGSGWAKKDRGGRAAPGCSEGVLGRRPRE